MNKDKNTHQRDVLIILASVLVVALSAGWLFLNGTFSINLSADTRLYWHLVRSSGIVAYALLLGSTVWGLVISGQFVKDWSPGPVSLTLHSTISWLALVLSLAHALLLLLDGYFTYTLGDLFIPFIGPYRPDVVGLGTLAFWGLVAVTLSFPFRQWMGHRVWKTLHYVSYFAFVLVTIHGLFAGTEGTHLGLRLMLGGGLAVVTMLLGIRIRKAQTRGERSSKPIAAAQSIRGTTR
jgi:methionine sulfoxide reductase heme-binding subunit